jgi:UDP-glucuronate 4-epimerase
MEGRMQNQHVLLTGAAGFIGFHVAGELLDRGVAVTGVDNLNAYYPVALKRDRLALLSRRDGFRFVELDIADHDALKAAAPSEITTVIHLAAQAGVRYSLDNPFAYAQSNLVGHLSVLELVRHHPNRPRLAYASSSSVYGDTAVAPYAESARVDHPVSLYAATKRSGELMSEAYAKLFGIEQVGLRFFTVYGPWGRPDMAYWTFTRDIIEGRPIKVFNNGDLERDFTWIGDIVSGVVAAAMTAPSTPQPLHRVYNIGNNRPVRLGRFIEIIEGAVGKRAERIMLPMQPGDVHATCANIDALARDHGYAPTTTLEEGIPRFVAWYRGWTGT